MIRARCWRSSLPDAPRVQIDTSRLAAGWAGPVEVFLRSDVGLALTAYLAQREAAGATIYPPTPWAALGNTSLPSVRVVILGQDPYHGPGQAHGLAFSVPAGVRPPPSLRNILVELREDCGCALPANGDLTRWARQGVLLLNTVLTVEEGRPASHAGRGWEVLTDALIHALAQDAAPKAFLLWGAHAQAKRALVEQAGRTGRTVRTHRVLAANHPSPLSARRPPVPFLGCRHFSQVNEFLLAAGRGAVDWCAPA